MRRQEAYALQTLDAIDGRQQVAQVDRSGKVVAVGVDVLTQERHFPDSALRQQLGLPDDVRNGPADLPTPPVRDDAEGAELVAAVDDGYVRRNGGPGGQRPDAALDVHAHALAEEVEQRLVLLGAHEYVHLGETPRQGIRLRPHHAPHQRDHLVRVAPLEVLQRPQHAGHLVLRALPHHAAIEHDDVGVLSARGLPKPQLAQRAFQALGVGLVHLAPYSPDMEAAWRSRHGCHGKAVYSTRPAEAGSFAKRLCYSHSEVAEGMGFEPMRGISPPNRLAGGRTRPLCDPSKASNIAKIRISINRRDCEFRHYSEIRR